MSDPASTRDLYDTDEWIMHLRKVPLRTIRDIARDREPVAVPFPIFSPFRGPRWWRLWSWLLWNFGDWLAIREKTDGSKQKHGRHRLVRGVPETAVYRPQARKGN